jgi:catechol 2,3-dioxygenase-like lactoylglutathione lyase family enzyme
MTTTATDTHKDAGTARCGCCGRTLPAGRLTELGDTPGVFICASCAVWAARRAARVPVVRLDPRLLVGWLRRQGRGQEAQLLMAIPILPSADLDRTAEFYRALGMAEVEQHEGYLLMHAGPVELHFTSGEGSPGHGEAFLHVPTAAMLWKRLKSQDVAGLGPLEDQPYGLREFVVVDPDGNRIRVGSLIPSD